MKLEFPKDVFIAVSTMNMIKSFSVCSPVALPEFFIVIGCISEIALEKEGLRPFYIKIKQPN